MANAQPKAAPDAGGLTVTLPWPARALHPNARMHYMAKARAAKKARAHASWTAKAAGLKKLDADAAGVTLTFSPPDRRRRDLDSMLASMKSALDGIADVIGVDDSAWAILIKRADPVKLGAVRIEIEPVTILPAKQEAA